MQKEFWQQKWESNEIGFNQDNPNELLIQYVGALSMQLGDRIFVPLCGKSVDMLWFMSKGFDVVGVELSSIACDAFFLENNIPFQKNRMEKFTEYRSESITIFCGDFFDLTKTLLGKVDAVYDRAALIALPPHLQQRYSTFMVNLLDINTPMLLIVGTYNKNEMSGPPFSIDEEEVKVLYGEHFDIKQLSDKPVEVILPHLKAKGLMHASNQVYYLTYVY